MLCEVRGREGGVSVKRGVSVCDGDSRARDSLEERAVETAQHAPLASAWRAGARPSPRRGRARESSPGRARRPPVCIFGFGGGGGGKKEEGSALLLCARVTLNQLNSASSHLHHRLRLERGLRRRRRRREPPQERGAAGRERHDGLREDEQALAPRCEKTPRRGRRGCLIE